MAIRYATTNTSSLGAVLVAANTDGICDIALGDSTGELEQAFVAEHAGAVHAEGDPELSSTLALLSALIDEPGASPVLRLSLQGTAFQQKVWDALRTIPSGSTITYSELAARMGAPGSSRAVAGACAANRLALVIPCHRVIRGDGSLSGYRWGVERKRALLERERAI